LGGALGAAICAAIGAFRYDAVIGAVLIYASCCDAAGGMAAKDGIVEETEAETAQRRR
jgi:hypothetical protein